MLASPVKLFASSCDIDSINGKLSGNGLFADFTQSKEIAALSRPLISKGQIWMSQNGELLWQVLTPFKSTMVIHKKGVRLYSKDDQFQGDRNHAMVTDISNIFLALLSGKLEQLDTAFSHELICGDNKEEQAKSSHQKWKLILTPKAEKIEKLISEIIILGHADIEQIHFTEKRGDKTEIHLARKGTEAKDQFKQYFEKTVE